MGDTTVTEADILALATKLEAIGDQFTPQEQATLHALFGLASAGIEAESGEVAGFAMGAFGVEVPGTNGILIGLNQSFSLGVAYGKGTDVGGKGGRPPHAPP